MSGLLNEPEDVQWLLHAHLKGMNVAPFRSFILVGNEDCPESVFLYEDSDPLITDKARIVNLVSMKEAASKLGDEVEIPEALI